MIKVMLIDDEPLILAGLKNIVNWNDEGFEIVATAKNGAEAWEKLQIYKVDVLVTDIKMPKMTGLDLIQRVNEKSLDIYSIILSGFQEFSLIKQGLNLGVENYLLKPINQEELYSTLLHIKEKIYQSNFREKSKWVLRDHAIWRWITGRMSVIDFNERMTFYPSVQISIPVKIGLLKVITEELNENFLDHLQMEIESSTDFISVITPRGDILLIRNDDYNHINEDEKNKIIKLLNNEKVYDKFCVVFSETVYKNEDLNEEYKKLERSIELKLILPNQDYQIAEELLLIGFSKQSMDDVGRETKLYMNNELIEELANGHFESSMNYVKYVFEKIESNHPSFIFKSFVLDFFYNIRDRFVIQIEYEQFIGTVHDILTIENKQDAIRIVEKCVELIRLDNQRDHLNYSLVIQKVNHYIIHHYYEEMSLKTLGTKFHINPIYLGQLFQKEVGCSFTKYLNKLRIERSKNIMLNSSEKAGAIGNKVGYSDATYFYKQFKKIENVTPSEWRKLHH